VIFFRNAVSALVLSAAIAGGVLGCHAQPPAGATLAQSGAAVSTPAGTPLPPELARRVEILLRTRTKLPADYTVQIGPRTASEVPGFSTVEVTFKSDDGAVTVLPFLLSADGKTLAQLNKYDLSKDPKTLVSDQGRPARGGPEGAPVDIVLFDDLECPYCARMHAQLFPALLDRYGKNVRIAYRDFPISQHPWAMRAAVDTNCLAAQNPNSYWPVVDYIHGHAAEFGGAEHSLEKANASLDQLTLDQAKKDGLNVAEVQACVKKQDDTAIKASVKLGDELGVEATPVLFINGEKLEGAYPLVDVFRMVDSALAAEGKTPPPPYVPPAAPAAAPKVAPATPSAAPGQTNQPGSSNPRS
jgi:protein-disulfide isomerase